ncbi:L-type lectin-domain containing receptor kinase SIT2 [Setaria viridis]|uniref:L-type lectin-domain containing receptor kinase SIT2 n=1 Tax=Setaria viridis TaxID=4556 RepID=UPI003B3B58B5
MALKDMTVCFLLVGLNLVALTAGDDHQLMYSGFAGSNLILDGAATVTASGLLELTNGTLRLKGHAIYPTPLRFRDASNGGATTRSFSTSFVFGILSAYPDVSANGIAFFVAASKDIFSGAMAAQYLGLLNGTNNGNATNRVFAVELDTMQNNEFGDISDNHVGIDINSLISANSTNAGYYGDGDGEFHSLTLISHEAMQAWVDYNSETKKINVTLAPLKMGKPGRPLLSATHDLSTVIPDMAYIGFSSSTGLVNSRHYVLGWSFAMDGPAPDIDIAKLPKLPREFPKPRSKVMEIILPIVTAAVVLFVGTVLVLLRRRQLRYTELREDWEVEFGPHRFSYKDLFRATEGFKNKNLLGVGGFGKVYKGVLPVSKCEIAVKRVSHNSKQGMKEFVAEIVSIGRMQHPNLVQLLGYCRRKGELLLVYEYMSNGSLDKFLYCQGEKATLNWIQRLGIIKGIASGLIYLHEEWEKVVVHRDIKASNVLLDSSMNGRLGDFGLAMLYDHSENPQTSHVVGTIGYLAPELGRTSKATTSTDIFAFGVFVLEVICGQKPIMQDSEDNQLMLVDWVVEHWNRTSLTDTVDAKLQGDYNVDEACIALKVGLLCSHPFPEARPSMRQVLQYLNGELAVPELVPAHLSFQMLTLMQNEGTHGLALVVAPGIKSLSTALTDQYMGLTNSKDDGKDTNHMLAVELDTVQNIEFKDMNANHVGIDINTLTSLQSNETGYYHDNNGSFQNLSLISREAMQVWVDYDGEATQINVTIAPLAMVKPKRPLISYIYNLSTVLAEPSYIGFSSATGPGNSRHYVLGWSFGMNKPAPVIDIAKLPKLPQLGSKPRSKVLEITLPIASAALVLTVGIAVVLLVRRRLRYTELREDWESEFGPHRFAYKDLFHATKGFKDKHLLGAGGFGMVYRGELQKSRVEVAVKKVSHGSKQGMKEFIAEIVSIGRIRHRNLVQLLGYCRRKDELILVYDYMSNGSLDKYLYSEEDGPTTLDWAQRFRIIKGVASGLHFLHERWEKVVIHRDIKTSNVLLDKEMNGRLGDFGLAKLYEHGANPQTTRVVGTTGYLAPELVRTGKATPLTDVFAFGTFMLEVTCGQRPIKQDEQGNQFLLVDWVLQHWHNGSLLEVVDPKLRGEHNSDEVRFVLQIGLLCAHPSATARPSMQQVLQYLDGETLLPEMTRADLSFNMLALLQRKGLHVMSWPCSSTMVSAGTISDLSGGR